jgi:thymidylate kinase
MNKVVLVDGVECSGKTYLVNKLKESFPEWKFIKCPAEKIIKKHFSQMMSDDVNECETYVNALMNDIRETFRYCQNNVLVFDRGWLSTLVYQGRRKRIIEMINEKYFCLFRNLDVDYSNSCTILMLDPIKDKIREDKNDCPEKLELAKLDNKEKLFRQVAYSENQLLPVYEFSYNKSKPTWIELNDLAGDVIEVA